MTEIVDFKGVVMDTLSCDYVDDESFFLEGEGMRSFVMSYTRLELSESMKGLILWHQTFYILSGLLKCAEM